MNRGYIKLWRRIEDNVSWSRGPDYRGLMVSILVRTCRRKAAFRGVNLKAGQMAVVITNWCEELGMDRSRLSRMLKTLASDGFISVRSMSNRFTVVTVRNWEHYQASTGPSRTTGVHSDAHSGAATSTHPVPDPKPEPDERPLQDRSASAAATEQDIKKYKTYKTPPSGGSPVSSGTIGRDENAPMLNKTEVGSEGDGGFGFFWSKYPKKEGRVAALKAWAELQRQGRLPHAEELAKALESHGKSAQWMRENGRFVPRAARWLAEEMWQDIPPAGTEALGEDDFLKRAREQRGQV